MTHTTTTTTTKAILSISAVTAVGILTVAAILPALFPAQEVFAPTMRRGYFCEFRPEQQLQAAYPIQAEIMAQTIAAQNGIGMLYLHN
jgi:hypothetical protein